MYIYFICCLTLYLFSYRHPGCGCDDGFYGDHCEFGEAVPSSNNGLIIGLSVGLVALLLILGGLFYCRQRKYRQRRSRMLRGMAKGYKDSAPPPTLDSINRLEQVNLQDIGGHQRESEAIDDVSSISPSESASQVGAKANLAFNVTPSSGRAILMKGGNQNSAGSATHSLTNIGSDYSTTSGLSRPGAVNV